MSSTILSRYFGKRRLGQPATNIGCRGCGNQGLFLGRLESNQCFLVCDHGWAIPFHFGWLLPKAISIVGCEQAEVRSRERGAGRGPGMPEERVSVAITSDFNESFGNRTLPESL